MNCRFCEKTLTHVLIDLGHTPPANAFLTKDQLTEPETSYPLKLYVCDGCFLVQVEEYKKSRDIFNSEYPYFSSFSETWLRHAKSYVEMMMERFGYDRNSQVIEIASNDGYLLKYFLERGVPSLGIEPAKGTAVEAARKGIETVVDFFNKDVAYCLAGQGRRADLLIGNNVLAHVPDLNDFVAGLKIILKPGGVITLEFPHLMQMIDHCQFDTIYHEHFSYLSFLTVISLFRENGLEIFDVQEIPTHGGSLRIFAGHSENPVQFISNNVGALLEKEISKGLNQMPYYENFQQKADRVKYDLLKFLIAKKETKRKVAAYGAAAKGNTLFNYCGVRDDLVSFVADISPHKQGKYLPGSHIPVLGEKDIVHEKPDFVLILPWNIREEIMTQLDCLRSWGGRFVIPVPEIMIL